MYYPINLNNDDGSENYCAAAPDISGCQAAGKSIELAMKSIKDAIADHLAILAEYGEKIPNAKPISYWQQQMPNGIWAVIEIDITPFLGKSHKINVTLPELLIKQIDDKVSKSDNYKTRSGFIANACIAELKK